MRAMHVPDLTDHAQALARALQRVGAATKAAWSTGNPTDALANATPYLQAFGHTVLAWIWLDVVQSLGSDEGNFNTGKRAAMRYFFHYELPKIDAWLAVVSARDLTCANVPLEAF
jgi:hypothetical protein